MNTENSFKLEVLTVNDFVVTLSGTRFEAWRGVVTNELYVLNRQEGPVSTYDPRYKTINAALRLLGL